MRCTLRKMPADLVDQLGEVDDEDLLAACTGEPVELGEAGPALGRWLIDRDEDSALACLLGADPDLIFEGAELTATAADPEDLGVMLREVLGLVPPVELGPALAATVQALQLAREGDLAVLAVFS